MRECFVLFFIGIALLLSFFDIFISPSNRYHRPFNLKIERQYNVKDKPPLPHGKLEKTSDLAGIDRNTALDRPRNVRPPP